MSGREVVMWRDGLHSLDGGNGEDAGVVDMVYREVIVPISKSVRTPTTLDNFNREMVS